MLVVRIELWSAKTGVRKELGCAVLYNNGTGTQRRGNYIVGLYRSFAHFVRQKPQHMGRVTDFPRLSLGVWDLLLRGLLATVYERNKTYVREGDASGPVSGAPPVYAPRPRRKSDLAGDA